MLSLADGAACALALVDHLGRVSWWSDEAAELLGYDEADALGRPLVDFVPPEQPWCLADVVTALIEHGTFERALDAVHASGAALPVRLRMFALHDGRGRLDGAGVGFSRVTPDERTADDGQVGLLESIVNSSRDGIAVLRPNIADGRAQLMYANEAFCTTVGRPLRQLLGVDLASALCPIDPAALEATFAVLSKGESVRAELAVRTPSGDRWLDLDVSAVRHVSGRVNRYVWMQRDVTDRKLLEFEAARLFAAESEAQALLAHQATHDSLTGLPNRLAFHRSLTERAQHASASAGLALLFIDLDGFKAVNDTLGHRGGDDVLVSVADVLRSTVRPDDMVARLGGDEFVVLVDRADHVRAVGVAQRIRDRIAALPISGEGVDASIGLVLAHMPADPEDLLRRADGAMYVAKHEGRGRIEIALDDGAARSPLVADVNSSAQAVVSLGQMSSAS